MDQLQYMPDVTKYLTGHGFTENEIRFVINKIAKAIGQINDPNMDNFRIGVPGDMEEYNESYTYGCCGFVDDTITLHNGKTVIYGFNYGH